MDRIPLPAGRPCTRLPAPIIMPPAGRLAGLSWAERFSYCQPGLPSPAEQAVLQVGGGGYPPKQCLRQKWLFPINILLSLHGMLT